MIWQYLEYSSELVWRPETCDTTRWRSDRHVYQLKQLRRQRKFDNFDLFLLFAMRVTVGWDNRLRRSIYSTQTGDAVDLPGAWDDYILQFYKSCWFSGLVIPHVPLAGRGPQTLSSVSCEEPTQQSSNWPKFLTLRPAATNICTSKENIQSDTLLFQTLFCCCSLGGERYVLPTSHPSLFFVRALVCRRLKTLVQPLILSCLLSDVPNVFLT